MMSDQKTQIPEFVRPFLWSYDISKLDVDKDKKRIITNILNYGTKQATDWLFSVFSKTDILSAVQHPLAGEWNKKSLHYWSFIFATPAGDTTRHIS